MENQYFDWQSRLSSSIPENMRIGDDLIIIEKADLSSSINIPRKFDVSTFIIVDKGSSRVVVEGKEYQISAPCIAVVMPNHTYYLLEASDDMSFRAMVMSKRFTDGLFGVFPQSNDLYTLIKNYPVIEIGSDMTAYNTFYKVLLNAVKSNHNPLRLESARHLTLSMLYFYARRLEQTDEKQKRQDRIFDAFCEDARANYRRTRNLHFYSGRLGVSLKNLTDIVKQRKGITAAEYIDWLTINESKALLTSTQLSVNQISRQLSFPSASVFGKFFKRMTGLSPTDYREETK